MDFGELKNDTDFISKVTNLEDSINAIERHMALMGELTYEDLSKENKVKYDLFQSFAINSLFFMYLKLQGIDPTNNENLSLKLELSKIKDAMKRENLFQDKKTMPRINQAVAKRFVLHGIQKIKEPENATEEEEKTTDGPVSKKRRHE
ncbi:nuclear nucleic acid-binding protein C1D [Culicoides brevitarsis]|uniref:nuclear nucleic acid-binding protein C1D n=1 Tax=Culicoides brevitarsis TaxID=469753 RepID=UPI00307C5CFE